MASDQEIVEDNILNCPCHEFETLSAVRSALGSEDKTRTLIAWLSASSGDSEVLPLPRLSCQPPGRTNIKCPNRYAVSFLILNGIRDACRSYLEESSSSSQQSISIAADERLTTGTLPTQPTYEESFPALSEGLKSQTPNVLTVKKKPKKKVGLTTVGCSSACNNDGNAVKTSKRRIRPAPAVVSTASAWGTSSVTTALVGLQGNISMLPSEEPFPLGSNFDRKAVFAGSPTRSPLGNAESRISTLEARKVTPIKRIPLETTRKVGNLKDVSKELGRLADVHATLVLNQLVPSTVLELHLLIRLLAVSRMATVSIREENGGLEDIFAMPGNCGDFAIASLKRLACIIRLLDLDLLEAFVACPPVETYLPDLKIDLVKVMEERRRKLHLFETPHGSITSPTKQAPIITLPFEQERDSRHNYRSRDDAILYKNREESRDAFLYQLRTFQNVRGKVLDPVQTERFIDKIRSASREVVRGLLLANMPWFAEMFCDLLLQIGLVPMEETDKDLLKIADKDKLQKLHKRFSSRNGTSSKSSKSLSLERNRAASSLSPVAAAQQYFPGHQEFFFIFLHATDSYNLSFHLRSYLRMKLMQLCESIPITGLGKTMSQLCLLSRFLGMLVFSPCWYVPRNGARDSFIKDEAQLEAELPVLDIVKQAWQKRCLSSTIPWAVEYLRMSQWDHSFQASSRSSSLLGFLIAIHNCLGPSSCLEAMPEALQVNCRRACFYLETLLGDIVGLDKIAFLPQTSLPLQQPLKAQERGIEQVDLLPISFTVSELSLGSPHIEELHSLLASLLKGQGQSTGTPRKLRPNAIRDNARETLRLSPSFHGAIETQTKLDNNFEKSLDGSAIMTKLKGAFFHQHRELKELCEFVAGRAMKNLTCEAREQAIAPCLANLLLSKPTTDLPPSQVQEEAVAAGREFLRSELTRTVRNSLDLLSPKDTQDQVKGIATTLAVEHSLRRADQSLRTAFDEELKKIQLKAEQPQTSLVAEVEGYARKEDTTNDSAANDLDKELALFAKCIADHDWDRHHLDVLAALERLQSFMETQPANQRTEVSSSVFLLDRDMLSLLVWCIDESPTTSVGPQIRRSIAAALLQTAASLRYKVSLQSCFSIAAHLSSDNALCSMVELGIGNGTSDKDMGEMGTIIIIALETRLIAPSILERVLIRMLERDSSRIAALVVSLLSRLSERGAHEKTWALERLRFRLALMGADVYSLR